MVNHHFSRLFVGQAVDPEFTWPGGGFSAAQLCADERSERCLGGPLVTWGILGDP